MMTSVLTLALSLFLTATLTAQEDTKKKDLPQNAKEKKDFKEWITHSYKILKKRKVWVCANGKERFTVLKLKKKERKFILSMESIFQTKNDTGTWNSSTFGTNLTFRRGP